MDMPTRAPAVDPTPPCVPSLEQLLLNVGTTFVYPRHAIVFVQGAPDGKMFYIRKGLVKYSFFTPTGAEKIAHFIGAGEIFGESAVLLDRAYGITATALTPVDAIVFTKEQTLALLRTDARFAELFTRSLAEKLWRFGQQLVSASFYDSYGRVVHTLLSLAPAGTSVNHCIVEITHQDLSNCVGLNRVTVTRVLRGLQEQGLVKCYRARIYIKDLQGLRRCAQQRIR